MLSPRYVGSDYTQQTVVQSADPGQYTPIDTNSLEMARSMAQQTMQGVRQSLQRTSEIQSSLSESAAQARLSAGQAEAAYRNRQRSTTGGLGGLVSGVGELYRIYSEMQAAEAERKKGAAWVSLNAELEDFIVRSEETFREDPGGYHNWQTQGDQIIGKYAGVLEPDQIVEATRRLYGGVRDVYNDVYTENRQQVNNIAWRESNAVIEDFISRSEDVLRGDTGYPGWQSQAQEIIAQYAPYLDSAQVVELTRRVYDTAQAILGDQASEIRQFYRENNENRRAANASTVIGNLSALLAQIEQPQTPEQLASSREQFVSAFQDQIAGLPIDDQLYVTAQVMQQLAQSSLQGTAVLTELNGELTNYNNFLTEYSDAVSEFRTSGNLDLYRARILTASRRYGIDLSLTQEFLDPTLQADYEYTQYQRRNDLLDRQRQEADRSLERVNLNREQIGSLAWTIYREGSATRELWSQYSQIPGVSAAIALAEARARYDELLSDYNRDRSAGEIQIRNLRNEDRSALLRYLTDEENQNVISELLGLQGNVSQGLEQAAQAGQRLLSTGLSSWVEQLRIAMGNQTPEEASENPEVIRLLNESSQERTDIANAIEERLKATENEVRLFRERELFPYGLGSPEREQQLQTSAATRVRSINDTIQRTQQEAVNNTVPRTTGTNPTRPRPQLQTMKVGVRGQEVTSLLPFFPGAPIQISSPYGESRRTDARSDDHAGLDISLPIGTPVVSYIDGTVVARPVDDEGYGIYVDIRDAEGYLHRFAHLSSLNVRDGQSITAGDTIGLSGNTGRSTGPHLHWEVRRPGGQEFSFNGTMNPLEFTSGLRNGQGRQERHSDATPTAVPANALRLSSGNFILDNQLWTSNSSRPLAYTTANPLRAAYAPTQRNDLTRLGNDAVANFGYRKLQENAELRVGIHKAANELGLPAMWLADVIAQESGFDFDVVNSIGARGLIQIMPFHTLQAEDEFDEIVQFFKQTIYPTTGQLNSVYEVLMAVWGGAGAVLSLRENPESMRSYADANINWDAYHRRLGLGVGRRYRPLYGATRIHTSYTSGCPVCEGLQRSRSNIVPHESWV